MDNKMKRGQIAIWVILAIVIVGMIAIVVILVQRNHKTEINVGPGENPQLYVEECVRKATQEAVDIMLPHGGFINPGNAKMYNDINISYLCKNKGNYLPCINQHPMYLNEMKDEIKNYVNPRAEKCFSEVKSELEAKNYDITLGEMNLDVEYGPGRIFIKINRDFKAIKGDSTMSYSNFDTEVISPLYDLALVAIEIASQEAKYCYFEYVGYMVLYPKFLIEKTTMSDSTKIYTITDKKTEKQLNIATRSCAIPPGI